MDMTFGKFKGKPVAWVLLNKPDYFFWMKREGIEHRKEYQFMLSVVKTLNEKPFSKVRCSGECKGANTPTRLSLYQGRYNMEIWFCDSCDLYYQGANLGKLSTIKRYEEFISLGDQTDLLIKIFCKAKGVPERKTKKALQKYFGY